VRSSFSDVTADRDSWLLGVSSISTYKYLKCSFRNVLGTKYDGWTGKERKL